MATAAAVGDKTLTPDDAVDIVEEILPAQNLSFELGLRLRLPHHEVEGIHSTHTDPRSRLLRVILAFLKQVEPRPTWRVIVDTLRSPLVNLTSLADKVEAAHVLYLTLTQDVVTETTTTASVQAASPSQRPVVVDLPETEEASTQTSVTGSDTVSVPLSGNVPLPQKRRRESTKHHTFKRMKQQTEDKHSQLTVQHRAKKKAPCEMSKGSATTDREFAYFTSASSHSVYSHEWSTEQWKQLLPSCPYNNSALVIIDGELTTVGGWESQYGCTNELLTMRQRQWVEKYPPMKFARSKPAAVSTSDGDYIIVIGGWDGDIDAVTAVVELFQVKTRQWYELTDLPQPLSFPSATICGNQVHVIGGDGNGYSCSLQASDEPQSLPDLISWTPLPPLPVTHSTAATLSGKLVIIGGKRHRSRVRSRVNSIHQLVEGEWVEIHSMTSRRWGCLSVSPSPDTVMIVGGWGAEHTVEEYFVS